MLTHRPQPDNTPDAQRYRLRGTLDISQVENLDAEVGLRVAVVHNNRVAHSQVLKVGKNRKIGLDLNFALPGNRCGIRLYVGRADLREADLLRSEPLQLRVTAAEWKSSDEKETQWAANIGQIAVSDAIYKAWWLRCRTYTIRGRVVCRDWHYDPIEQQWVFTDAPVAGATVEVFDVDRWLWFYFKDQIGTAVTGVDGTFELTIRWCCRTLFPFPWRIPWQIDPDILRRFRELVHELPHGPILPDPPPDPLELQDYLERIVVGPGTPSPISADVETGPPNLALTAANLQTVLPAAPDLAALHIWPWWNARDCAPDVIFRVTQPCEGNIEVIYEESVSQTRWNIPQNLDVILEANEKACCVPVQPDPPCGDCLAITMVGCTTVDNIGLSAGPPDLRGYAYPGTLDRPFGGNLVIRGDFGEDSHPILDFYRVEYRKETMPPGIWLNAHDVAGMMQGIVRKYFDASAFPAPYLSPGINFGPQDFVSDGNRYYMSKYKYQRDNTDPVGGWIWTNPDYLFRVNTTLLPQGDGLYSFRVIGYRQASDGSLVDARVMPICVDPDIAPIEPAEVMVRVDNRTMDLVSTSGSPCGLGTVTLCTSEPHVDIINIVKNEGTSSSSNIGACDFENIADSDLITIHFRVTVPATANDGHLMAYEMTGHYGDSGLFNVLTAGTLSGDPTPQFGPTYAQALAQGAVRPYWYGGDFKVVLPGSAFPVSCAYLIKLRAWKRTFSGCNNPYHFHANVAEFSFCVTKP